MKLNHLFNHHRLQSYAAFLKAQGLSDATVHRKLSSLSGFQKFLIKKKYLLAADASLVNDSLLQDVDTSVDTPLNPPLPKLSFLNRLKSNFNSLHTNRPVLTYTLVVTLIIALGALGYGIYYQTILKAKTQLAYSTASSPVRPSRILSFQGRLTDTSGNPITSNVPIEFRLYDSDVGGTSNILYDSWTNYGQGIGLTTVTPDDNGVFSIVIGKTHGGPIPITVFSENSEVWLGITVSGETMAQRQQIATVAYALNSDTLQGLPPSASGLKNTLLVIDENGNINLGETSPTIISQSGTFGIIGNSLLIGTTDLSDGNITLNPDGSGILKLITEGAGSTAVGGLIEATNANLATGNLYSGLIRNDNRGYNFVSYQNYNVGTTQLSTRFSIDASGNAYLAGALTSAIGATLPQITLSVGASAGYLLQSDTFGNASWVNASTSGIGNSYDVGSALTRSGNIFKFGGAITENTRLNIGNTEVMYFDYSTGRFGIGTTNPSKKLDILGDINLTGTVFSSGTSGSPGQILSSTGTSLSWINPSSIGTTYAVTNGLNMTNNIIGLGGTLTANTNIGVSSFGLTFLGLNNNTQALYIGSNGSIGIGTTNPSYLLDVNANARINGNMYVDALVDKDYTGNTISFPSAQLIRINGIFDISADSGRGSLRLFGSNWSGNGATVLNLGYSNPTTFNMSHPSFSYQGIVVNADATLNLNGSSGSYNQNVSIFKSNITTTADTVGGERKFLDFSKDNVDTSWLDFTGNAYFAGNVGIGTTSPTSKLHVVGNANITTNLNVGGTLTFTGINLGTGTTALFIDSNGVITQRALGNLAFADSAIGTTYSAGSGLSLSSGVFNLGGPLTQNTRLNIGATETLYIDYNTGRVGIGTTSPDAPFNVRLDTNTHFLANITNMSTAPEAGASMFYTSATSSGAVGVVPSQYTGPFGYFPNLADRMGVIAAGSLGDNADASGLDLIAMDDVADMRFYTGGGFTSHERMRILANGNIGIGTTSPQARLDVNGNLRVGTSATIGTNLSVGGSITASALPVGVGTSILYIDSNGVITRGQNIGTTYGAANGLNLTSGFFGLGGTLTENTQIGTSSFGLSFLGLGGTQSLFIASNGNVGIGTTNPQSKLQISGGALTVADGSSGGIYFPKNNGTNYWQISTTSNNNETFQIQDLTSSRNYLQFDQIGNHMFGGGIFMNPSGNSDFRIVMSTGFVGIGYGIGNTSVPARLSIRGTASGDLLDVANIGGTSAFRITATGNVGIGTSSPSKKLDIAGDINLTGTIFSAGTSGAPGQILSSTGTALSWISPASIGTTYGAANGISLLVGSTNVFGLGGTLTQNTQIGTSSFGLSFLGLGGTQSLFIASNGNVGIGNTEPIDKMQVTGGTLRLYDEGSVDSVPLNIGGNLRFVRDEIPGSGLNHPQGDSVSGNSGSYVIQARGNSNWNNIMRLYYGGIGILNTLSAPDMRLTGSGNNSVMFADNTAGYEFRLRAYNRNFSIGGDHTNSAPTWPLTYFNIENATGNIKIGGTSALNSPSLTVLGSGNVGVGTSSPDQKVSIHNAGVNASYLSISNSVTASADYSLPYGGIRFYSDAASGAYKTHYSGIEGTRFNGIDSSGLYFYHSNNAVAQVGMVLSDTGSLGIGTTSPTSKLHVIGDANITTNLNIGGTLTFTGVNVGTGTTALFIDASGILTKRALGALAFQDSAIGTTYAAGSGLTLSSNTFKLGGTLTENTTIDTSSFSLTIGQGTTQALFISSGGNIGMGTTNPTDRLEVTGNIKADRLNARNNNSYLSLSTAEAVLFGDDALRLRTESTGIDRLFIDYLGNFNFNANDVYFQNSTGNVGIGTTSPTSNLHVVGTNNGTLLIESNSVVGTSFNIKNTAQNQEYSFGVTGSSNGYGNGSFLFWDNTHSLAPFLITAAGRLRFGSTSGALAGSTANVVGNLSVGSSYYSYVAPNNGLIVEGSVGIGTSSPLAKLNVSDSTNGNKIIITDTAAPVNGVTKTSTIAFKTLDLYGAINQGAAEIRVRMTPQTGLGGAPSNIDFVTQNGSSPYDNAERLTITHNGLVGIGTTAPTSRLHVIGNANITTNLSVGGTLTLTGLGTTIADTNTLLSLDASNNVRQVNTSTWDKNTTDDLTLSTNLFAIRADSGTAEILNVGNTINFVGGLGLGSTVSATDTITFNIGSSAGITVNTDNIGVNAGSGLAFSGNQLINSGILDATNSTLTRSGALGSYTLGLNLASSNVWSSLQSFSAGIGVTGNSTFQNNLTIGGTLSAATLSLGSTNVSSSASELNLLDGTLSTLGSVIYGDGSKLANTAVGASGQVLMSNGANTPVWMSIPGATSYTAGVGLSLTPSSTFNINVGLGLTVNATNQIGIDYSRSNLWSSLQTFGAGIGVTGNSTFQNNLTIGGTFVSVGSTNLVTNLNANYLNGYTYNNLPYEAPLTFQNGLTRNANTISLGGTLTQNTQIGTSSFGLSFVGINSNTQALYIASNGNIGLGTTSPTALLNLNATSAATIKINQSVILNPANAGGIELIEGEPNLTFGVNTYGYKILHDGSSNLLRFQYAAGGAASDLFTLARNNSSVGIGTTNPTSKLTVSGSLSDSIFSVFDGYYNTNLGYGTSGQGTERLSIYKRSDIANFDAYSTSYPQNSAFSFKINSLDRMFLSNSGSLGLGTTNPTSRLHVVGDANITTNLSVGGTVTFSGLGTTIADTNTLLTLDVSGNVKQINTSTWDKNTADDYLSWILNSGSTNTTINSGTTVSFVAGTGIGITLSGSTITINSSSIGTTYAAGIGLSLTPTNTFNINLGTGITTNASNQISLTTTGVSGATYGSGTSIPVIAIDNYGRITSASQVLANFESPLTFQNGLNRTGNSIGLGGTLTQNTQIDTSSFGLSFLGLGGTQGFYQSSTGNVGIGTTNPLSKLEVVSPLNTSYKLFELIGNTSQSRFLVQSNGYVQLSGLAVSGGDSTLRSAGSTDIGLSPAAGRTAYISSVLYGAPSGYQTAVAITPNISQSGTAGYQALYINPTETSLGSSQNFLINAAVAGISRLALTNTGNLGLGTTNPSSRLHVVGDANITTNLTIGGTFVSVGSTNLVTNLNANYLNGYNYNNLPYEAPLTFQNGLTRTANTVGLGGTLTQNTQIGTSSFSLSFLGLGGTQSLFIASNGNVGVDNTNPTYPFQVRNWAINTNGQIVSGAPAGNVDVSSGGWRVNTLSTGNHNQTLTLQNMTASANGVISTRIQPWINFGATAGRATAFQINPTINQTTSAGNYTALDVNPSITTSAGNLNYLANFQVANSSRVVITDTGNIGIGTTTPTRRLDVIGDIGLTGTIFVGAGVTGANGQVLTSDGAGSLTWTAASGVGTTYRASNGLTLGVGETNILGLGGNLIQNTQIGTSSFSLVFNNSSGNSALTIAPTGNIAIGGTASDSDELSLFRNQDDETGYSVTNLNNSANASSGFKGNTSGVNYSFGALAPNYTGPGGLFAHWAGRAVFQAGVGASGITIAAALPTSDIRFFTGSGLPAGERLRITASGNVGIGTTNPTSRLHVVGDANITTNLSVGGSFVSVGSTNLVTNLNADLLDGQHANNFVSIGQTGSLPYVNNTTDGTLTRTGSGPFTLGLNLGNTNVWTGNQTFSAGAVFGSTNTGIWNSAGSLGIGTTDPGAFQLNVAGNANISGALTIGDTLTLNNVAVGSTTNMSALILNGSNQVVQRTLNQIAFDGQMNFAEGLGIDLTGTGVGTTFALDPTELGINLTWGAGTTFTWTFNAGATQPSLSFRNNTIDMSGSFINSTVLSSNRSLTRTIGTTSVTLSAGSTFAANELGRLIYWPDGTVNKITSIMGGTATIDAAAANTLTATPTFRNANFFIDDLSQKIGINTANPREALEVNGNISANKFTDLTMFDKYYLDPANSSDNASTLSLHRNGSVRFNSFYNTGLSQWQHIVAGASNQILSLDEGLFFSVSDTGPADSQITGNVGIYLSSKPGFKGNVGIGTTSPRHLLDIQSQASIQLTGLVNLDAGSTEVGCNTICLFSTEIQPGDPVEIDNNRYTVASLGVGGDANVHFFLTTNALSSAGGVPVYTSSNLLNISDMNNQSSLYVGRNGRVGIGTTSPQARLSIFGTSSLISNTSGDITLNSASNNIAFSGDSLTNINDIYLAGRLGIGTTNPEQQLEVVGSAHITDSLSVDSSITTTNLYINDRIGIGTTSPLDLLHLLSDTSNSANLRLEFGSTQVAPGDIYGSIIFNGNDSSTNATGTRAKIEAYSFDNQGATGLNFYTAASASLAQSNLTLDPNGNLGLGNTSPTHNLEIYRYSGTVDFRLQSGSQTLDLISDDNNYQIMTSGANPLIIGTNSVEQLRIDANGNIGIGTPSPNAKFDINTENETSALKVNQTGNGNIIEANNNSGSVFSVDSDGGINVFSNNTVNSDTWSTIPAISGAQYIKSSIVFGDRLYFGEGGTVAGSADIWIYDDGVGQNRSVGFTQTYIDSTHHTVNAMAVFNGKLYAAMGTGAGLGDIMVCDPTALETGNNEICENGEWEMLYNSAIYETADSLGVFDGGLYAGFGSDSGDADVIRFESIGTSAMVYNGSTTFENALSMTIFDNRLFVGLGVGNSNGDIIYITDTGTSATAASTNSYDSVEALGNFNGKIYSGMGNDNGDGDIRSAPDGMTYTVVFNSSSAYSKVNAFMPFDGYFFSGVGDSLGAGNILMSSNGNSWATDWDGTRNSVYTLTVYHGKIYGGYGTSGTAGAAGLVYRGRSGGRNSYTLNFKAGSGIDTRLGSLWLSDQAGFGSPDGGISNTAVFKLSHSLVTNANAYDIAEDFASVDNTLGPGDIVSADPNNQEFIQRTDKFTLNSIIGIVSTHAGFRLSSNDTEGKYPVALAGRVPVKVDPSSPAIKIGDALAVSPNGKAIKTDKAGFSIGKALANWTPASNQSTVLVFINLGYYDPNISLTPEGQVNLDININPDVLSSLGYTNSLNEIESAQYYLKDTQGNIINRLASYSQLLAAKIETGLLTAQNIITHTIVSENTKSKNIQTARITPLSDLTDTIAIDGNVSVTDTLTANKIGASQAEFDVLYANRVIGKEGDFGDLMTGKISSLREEIKNFISSQEASSSSDITGSTLLAQAQSWQSFISFESSSSAVIDGSLALSDNLVVGARLTVLGDSQFGSAFITGTLTAGEIAIKDNLIETTNSALYIQPSGTGSVHIMGDTLIIADNGDITINGNLAINGTVTTREASVSGSLFAALIKADELEVKNATVSGIANLNEIKVSTDSATAIIAQSGFANLATSSAKLTSNATAGIATLPAGKTEIIIYNQKLTNKSMVYLTPNGSTQNQVVYIKNKIIEEPTENQTISSPSLGTYFTIAIDQPLPQNIDINWWIIN